MKLDRKPLTHAISVKQSVKLFRLVMIARADCGDDITSIVDDANQKTEVSRVRRGANSDADIMKFTHSEFSLELDGFVNFHDGDEKGAKRDNRIVNIFHGTYGNIGGEVDVGQYERAYV